MLQPNAKRILAIDLRSRSFGFAVFEGPTRLLDWGAKSFRQGTNAVKIPAGLKFSEIMDDFLPSTIVLRKSVLDTKKRADLRNALLKEAEKRRIPIRLLSRSSVKNAFPDCNRNKYTIAAALAKQLPELAPKLPGVRKIWKSEDYRMSIFDAAALGVTYFSRRKSTKFDSSEIDDRDGILD
jgi:hypothetical protein